LHVEVWFAFEVVEPNSFAMVKNDRLLGIMHRVAIRAITGFKVQKLFFC
jgi:hypothetical protein